MPAIISRLSAMALLLSCSSTVALAPLARADADLSYRDLVRQVANTSIVWVDPGASLIKGDTPVAQTAALFGKIVARYARPEEGIKAEAIEPTAIYETLGAFVLPVAPEDAQKALDQLPAIAPEDARMLGTSIAVTSDMIVSLLDATDCSDKRAKELSQSGLKPNTMPVGVQRVRGGKAASYKRKVWIVDTGLDNASQFIHVDANAAANCTLSNTTVGGPAAMCKASNASTFDQDLTDRIGHGTMLAGIIAASGSAAGPSLVGVAPGATVVPVKIFGGTPDINLSGPPLAALDYIARNAATGDIVNLSWGASWLEGMDQPQNQLSTVWGPDGRRTGLIARLKKLIADKQLTIVTAAGNVDSVTRPSWVQFIMPAGAGSYPQPNTGCRLCTVSAVESTLQSGKWTDKFWFDNNPPMPTGSPRYGSAYGRNPPDFAEPGVDVISLWPRGATNANRINTCSGTSFAAPHLAGILVRGTVATDYNVTGDPDSPNDKKTADPMGVLGKNTAE